MQTFKRFIPIAKVDKAKKMVFGWATTPDLDSDDEMVSLDGIEKALPEYLKFPTIREMHQPIAAGTTVHADIRKGKGQKGLYIGAKIVDKAAWEKVEAGVYRGFSIGGDVIQKVGNLIKSLSLVEISLVDVPANKAAKIELWKAESYWKRSFSDAQRKQLAGSGKALPDGSFPIVTVQDLKNAIRAIGRAKDPAAARAHIKRRARALGASSLIPKDWGKAHDISVAKNAHSMSAYHGLLSHAQDVANHLAAHGKNTKKVDRMVEDIKGLVAKEAEEPEEPRNAPSGGNMSGDGFMGGVSEGIAYAAGLQQRASALEKMEFDTPAEKLIAKEVIKVLKNKAKELNEEEEEEETKVKKSETRGGKHAPADARDGTDLPEDDNDLDEDDDDDEGEDFEDDDEDKKEEDEDEEEDDAQAAGSKRPNPVKGKDITSLSKIEKSLAKLEKMSPSKVEKEQLGLTKAVAQLAVGFEKMTTIIGKLQEEIDVLKKQPAALKSKSVAVFRNSADKEEMTKSNVEKSEKAPLLKVKKARYAELDNLYNTLGKAEYGRRGLGIEASILQDEIKRLEQEVEA